MKPIVNNGLIPGGFSKKMGRQVVCFTVVNPMDDKQGLRETYQKQESHLTKIFGNDFRIRYIGAIYCSLKRRVAIFPNKV